MRTKILAAAVTAGLAMASQAAAQTSPSGVVHIGAPTAAIASAVSVPAGADMLYVSGITPTPNAAAPQDAPTRFGDTQAQTLSILTKIGDILKAQGYGYGDVVMMRVYLVGDPAKGGKMDFDGMMAAYRQFFGTAEQPNKPARVTMQVASLVAPGMLCEIEVQAAKPRT